VIDRATASNIIAFEQQRPKSDPSGRRSVVAEAIGSFGAIAAAVAAIVGTATAWDDLATALRIAIPAVGAVILFVAGAVVPEVPGDHDTTDPAMVRLGALLWLLACGALATTIVIAATDALDLPGEVTGTVTGGTLLAVALPLLRRRPTPHLHVPVIAASTTLVLAVLSFFGELEGARVGIALTVLGVVVMIIGARGVLPSVWTTVVLGTGLAFVGAEMFNETSDVLAVIVGLVLAAGTLAAFVRVRHQALLVSGLFLAAVFVVQGVVQITSQGDGNAGAIAAIFVLGLVALGASVWAIRRTRA
jgi:uncharacterized membrane protein (UPF0136 family)